MDSHITIPDGSEVHLLHVGTVKLTDDNILHKVLHVPDLHFRLISVSKLCEDLHCQVTFNADKYFLQDPFRKGLRFFLVNSQMDYIVLWSLLMIFYLSIFPSMLLYS